MNKTLNSLLILLIVGIVAFHRPVTSSLPVEEGKRYLVHFIAEGSQSGHQEVYKIVRKGPGTWCLAIHDGAATPSWVNFDRIDSLTDTFSEAPRVP